MMIHLNLEEILELLEQLRRQATARPRPLKPRTYRPYKVLMPRPEIQIHLGGAKPKTRPGNNKSNGNGNGWLKPDRG